MTRKFDGDREGHIHSARQLQNPRGLRFMITFSSVMGHNLLKNMMPLLSLRAKLSTRYTNHCVRASVVTDLKNAGYSNHEVCSVTGHKNESSLQHYDHVGATRRPAEMADILYGALPKRKHCSAVATPAPQKTSLPPQPGIGAIYLRP